MGERRLCKPEVESSNLSASTTKRRRDREAEGARLLSECGSQSHPGFESLRLRQKMSDNSTAECHPYKVEVVGSNPTLTTTIGD